MDTIDQIKKLYHSTTKATIQRDLTKAVALLKTLETEEDRERVAVYMDGLSQMRSEWGVNDGPTGGGKPTVGAKKAKVGAKKAPGGGGTATAVAKKKATPPKKAALAKKR